jgi:hypothetical protein
MERQPSVCILLLCGLWVFFQQQLYGLKALGVAHVTHHKVKWQTSVRQLLLCG